MDSIPKYPKVLNLGAPYTQNALVGDVVIQEKIDGSQLRWGYDDKGEIHVGSKGREIHSSNQDGMFALAFDYLTKRCNIKSENRKNVWFYGEYLQKPKHNCLKYDSVPKNNIVLFDCLFHGEWLGRDSLGRFAQMWGIDLIPELWCGDVLNRPTDNLSSPSDFLRCLANDTTSYLGGTTVEGLVIKNYGQVIEMNGQARPLTTKFVRDEFREKHMKANPSMRQTIEDVILGLRSENRWNKAIQHLRDDGKLLNDVKDIGNIIKEIHRDLLEEEGEAIKAMLWEKYRKHVMATAVRGFPDWYKDKLMEEQNGKQESTDS